MKKIEFMENSLRIAKITGFEQQEVISKMTGLLKGVRKKLRDVCGVSIEDDVIYIATANASFQVDIKLESIERYNGNPAGYSVGKNETGHRLPSSAPSRRW
jgi:hypothetical protein